MKGIEQYPNEVLIILMYKVVQNFEPVEKSLKCEVKATEQYFPVVLFICQQFSS